MIVVYVSDENYLFLTERSAKSLLKIHPDARIIIVSPYKLETYFENFIIPFEKEYRRKENDRITSAAYLKLYLTKLPFDKILYLDGDVIVQKPLDELWNMECKYINITESHNFGKEQAKALGVEKYGMTSVMLMNLKALRRINFTKKCLEVEASGLTPSTGWQHDETCINVAMKGKLTFIDKKFNYCHERIYDEPINEIDAVILHVCGKDKSLALYEPYSEIKEVKNFIKSKSVAIVGNAKSIFETKHGKEIDAHDVVIRFNKGFVTEPQAQGTRTDVLFLACELNLDEKSSYKAMFSVNRSNNTHCGNLTIKNEMRRRLKSWLGSQPSTGFMAIDICRESGAKKIDLYGFDFEKTPTFYNPEGYLTQHNYNIEKKIVHNLQENGILEIK